jgi:hypothetical protein
MKKIPILCYLSIYPSAIENAKEEASTAAILS